MANRDKPATFTDTLAPTNELFPWKRPLAPHCGSL